jgi:hypothetical protein
LLVYGRACADTKEITDLLPDAGRSLRWSVRDVYDGIELTFREEVPETERTIPEGTLGFEAMRLFWSRVRQTWWAIYIAAPDDATALSFPVACVVDGLSPEFLSRYPYIIQGLDSSVWCVHSTDTDFLWRVQATYPCTQRLDPLSGRPMES